MGIYRHGILGVYTLLEKAIKAGTEFVDGESDHYHSVEIVKTEIDSGPVEIRVGEVSWSAESKLARWQEEAGIPVDHRRAPEQPPWRELDAE